MASILSPSPLPKALLAAYRKPMELFQLAMSDTMLSESEKRLVHWRLAMAANRLFGPLTVDWYDAKQGLVEGPLLELVVKVHEGKISSVPATSLIGEIVQHRDVTRKLALVDALASILQPYWARTWERFSRGEDLDKDIERVVGRPQLQWIRTQTTKVMLRKTAVKPSGFARDVIRRSERFALELAKDKFSEGPDFDEEALLQEVTRSESFGLALIRLASKSGLDSVSDAFSRIGQQEPKEKEQLRSLFAWCFGDHPPTLTAEGWGKSLYIDE